MTPEAQRVAIAEWEGWIKLTPPEPLIWKRDGIDNIVGYANWRDPSTRLAQDDSLPNYLNDRTALIEVVSKLKSMQLAKFANRLQEITDTHCVGIVPDHWRDLESLGKLICSPLTAISEALLRTVGRWEDE